MATRVGYDKGTTLSPAKAPGMGAKANANVKGGTGRPSGQGNNPAPRMSGSQGGKGDMFKKEAKGSVSSKEKKFKSMAAAKKRFGFGNRQYQGVKGQPQNYGSA